MKIKKFGQIGAAVICMALLCSCSAGKKSELPEDAPWNHGYQAIMETDDGYYSNSGQKTQCLRYFDKISGETILVCSKPECLHEGDGLCEATYKDMMVINSVLYDGAIYVLGVEGVLDDYVRQTEPEAMDGNLINISIYRAALDGSAIDKVGTVFEAENPQKEEVTGTFEYSNKDCCFIIHKGVAYVPFLIRLGQGSKGLRGGGIMKMDLATGKTEQIYEMKTLQYLVPTDLAAVGDYVYFDAPVMNSQEPTLKRYVISKDLVEPVNLDYARPDAFDCGSISLFPELAYGKDRIYRLGCVSEGRDQDGQVAVFAHDAKTGELIREESFISEVPFNYKKSQYVSSPREGNLYQFTYYEEKFLLSDQFGAYWYDKTGKKLGEMLIPEDLGSRKSEKNVFMEYKISNNQLYFVFGNASLRLRRRVFSCPLEDSVDGKGKWKEAYATEGIMLWKDMEKLLEKDKTG